MMMLQLMSRLMKTYRRKPPSKQVYALHSVGQLGSASGYRFLSDTMDSERMASRGGRSGPSSGATLVSSRLRLSLLGAREKSSDVFSEVKRESSPKVSLGSMGSYCCAMASVLGGSWWTAGPDQCAGLGDRCSDETSVALKRGCRLVKT
jgi:hypothetical protein